MIRGNPWGLDKGVVNNDWPYVIFDWDNHFGEEHEPDTTISWLLHTPDKTID